MNENPVTTDITCKVVLLMIIRVERRLVLMAIIQMMIITYVAFAMQLVQLAQTINLIPE